MSRITSITTQRQRLGRAYISLHGLAKEALIARAMAVLFAIAAAGLAVYGAVLVYAAATFDSDSLPGATVMYMVAVGVGLAAFLCGGLARLLWMKGRRESPPREVPKYSNPDASGE